MNKAPGCSVPSLRDPTVILHIVMTVPTIAVSEFMSTELVKAIVVVLQHRALGPFVT